MKELLEYVLPSKLSLSIVGATTTLATSVLFLNELTQRLGLESLWTDKLHNRLTLVLIIIFLGLVALVISLLIHIKTLNKPKKEKVVEPNFKVKLEQLKVEALILLSKTNHQTTKQIYTSLNITEQLALFHLTELFNSDFITNSIFMDGRPVLWRLNQNGRAYLVSNNLL